MDGQPFIVRLHLWMQAHKALCFALTLLCWAVAALLAARMQPDASSMAFFPDDAPQIRRMAEALDISPASRLLFVDLSTRQPGGKFALAAAADAIVADLPPDLAERAQAMSLPRPEKLMALLPYYTDEAALEFFKAAVDKDRVEAAVRAARLNLSSLLAGGPAQDWLLADPLGFRRFVLSRLPAQMANTAPDPELGYPVSNDGTRLLLVLRPRHSLHQVDAAAQLVDAVQAALRRHLGPDMQSLVVGGLLHSAVNARTIQQDVARIVIFSMAGFVLVYLLLVRSRGALWLLLTPAFAASLALGGMTLFSPTLSGLALGFGASVLGVAEDYAVHMHFALRSGNTAGRVLKTMTRPLFQGYLINASGFVVLLLSGLPAVRQLACFALLTLSAGFALAVTILPLCPWFAAPAKRLCAGTVLPRQPVAWRVTVCALGLLAVCCGLFSVVQVDVSPRTMGADMARLRQEAERLKVVWGSRDSNMLVVEGPSTESAVTNARTVTAALRRLEPGNTVSTLTDLWPGPDQARANVERWTAFVRTHGKALRADLAEAAQANGFKPEAFSLFTGLLERQVPDLGPESLRQAGLGELLSVFLHTQENASGTEKVLLFTKNPPDISGLEPPLAGQTLALAPGEVERALLRQLRAEKHLVPLAWLACFGLLFVFFWDIRRTLLASLPPLCSIACILAWMACTGQALTLASMAAMPLVLGLSADHGIVVTHDLAQGVKMGVERAVLVSSLTTLLGMGLLALAQHPALKAMGEVIFWGLLVEVPAALCLLPLLCRTVEKKA